MRKRRKQKLKQIREQKESYRRKATKKAIKFSNKKNAADLLKEYQGKQKPIEIPVSDISDAEPIQYAEPCRDTSKKGQTYRKKLSEKSYKP